MRFLNTILAISAALLLCVSCSIKEDRSLCPCILNLDWSEVQSDERISDSPNKDSVLLLVGDRVNEIVRLTDYPDGQSVNIQRTKTFVDCYLGFSPGRLSSNHHRMTIPLGEDCERFFSCHRVVEPNINTEELSLTPKLSNEFTKVIIEFEDPESGVSNKDNILRVTGSSCGLDLLTGLALSGEFRYDMDFAGERSWYFNMPRQRDKDIKIDVLNRTTGDKAFSIDLALELDNAGYGWAAESLAPLVIVKISARNVPVEVKIIDWDEAIYFNYTL